jgi:hypothetical protein
MNRAVSGGLTMSAAILAALCATSCVSSRALIKEGDANSVTITDNAGDVDKALPLARQHCEEYGRAARLNFDDVEENLVKFDCVKR